MKWSKVKKVGCLRFYIVQIFAPTYEMRIEVESWHPLMHEKVIDGAVDVNEGF